MKNIQKHGGNLSEEAKRLKIKEKKLLDASASIVPFKPPKSLKKCLFEAIKSENIRNYPDCNHTILKEKISKWHDIPPEMVMPGNGASELFTWAAREAKRTGVSGIPSPGFSDYERALNCWEANYIHLPIPLPSSNNSPKQFPLMPETDVIWITNPHNPSGELWSKKSLEPLIANKQLIICDEAFLPLVPNGENESLLPLTIKHPNIIVIRSLTKLFAIAGLRLGYAVSSPARLKDWELCRDPWPLNNIAIAAGINLFDNRGNLKNWINKIQRWVKHEGEWFRSQLLTIEGIDVFHSSANFYLIKSKSSLLPVRERLAKNHILVRDCRSFKCLGDQYLRISLQSRKNNKRIIRAIKEAIR